MSRPRTHLTRAPIVEAVIDFRVLRQRNAIADQFAGLAPRIGEQYNQASQMQSIEARFGLGGAPSQTQAPVGWLYKAPTAVAQFRVDGFTFSKLEPYTTWEEVFGEASRLWGIYSQLANPQEISRVAVRYINRLRLPAPADLGQYLESPPVLPPPIPQTIREYLTRVVIEDTECNLSAVLIQALEGSLDPATTQILLDIDAFRNVVMRPEDPAISGLFEQLRRLKNEIFYASITEATVRMYE